jgi:hypothetical protein
MTTSTFTTTTKQAVPQSAPTPARTLKDDPTTSEPDAEPAVESNTSAIDTRKNVQLASNEPFVASEYFDPITVCAAVRRATPAKKNSADVFDFDAFLGLETAKTVEEKTVEEKTEEGIEPEPEPEPEREPKKPREKCQQEDGCNHLTALLLEQNRFLIDQLADQNKSMVDRLVAPSSYALCATCGGENQKLTKKKKGGAKGKDSEKEKSDAKRIRALFWTVDTVIRRILRICCLVLLVVIAVQLGSIRGEGFEAKSGRKAGFFGR